MTDAVTRRHGGVKLTRKAGTSTFTEARQERFLEELARSANVARSARLAGATERQAYYRRTKDVEFRRRWQAALIEAYDEIEAQLLKRALNGYRRPLVWQGRRRGSVREQDPGLMLRLLAIHRESARGSHAPAIDPAAARAELDRRLDEMAERLARPLPDGVDVGVGAVGDAEEDAEGDAGGHVEGDAEGDAGGHVPRDAAGNAEGDAGTDAGGE